MVVISNSFTNYCSLMLLKIPLEQTDTNSHVGTTLGKKFWPHKYDRRDMYADKKQDHYADGKQMIMEEWRLELKGH